MTLLRATDAGWTAAVTESFDQFLLDHAACERKASAMAVSLVVHYPDRPHLVSAMTDLAIEELAHFREVMKLVLARRLTFRRDEKDAYVNALSKHARRGTEEYLLDRLLIAAVVEARGCERFALLGEALTDPEMAAFYRRIAASESRHAALFVELAQRYAQPGSVASRLDELLGIEAALVAELPFRPALH
ncbi:MAG: tRNA-(ms[2]io[6]A)-hydroxylase [Pseudomonadota bacterium]